jgi:D-arabinose 1-dehydrogenase-like Zn-dependent alcohol dehydrogenase
LSAKNAQSYSFLVVAISSTRDKEDDARSFGAHEFIYTQKPITSRTKMDFILNTVSGDLPWDAVVDLLDANGTLINMGLAGKDTMEIPYMPALFRQSKTFALLAHLLSL